MSVNDQLAVGDIASTHVLTIEKNQTVRDAVRILADHRVSCLIVQSNSQPVGILTERDIVRIMTRALPLETAVCDVMSEPLYTLQRSVKFPVAQLYMHKHQIRHLVLLEEHNKLWGVVSETDFRTHLGRDLFARIQALTSVMDSEVSLMSPDASLRQAVDRMSAARLDHVVVAEQGQPLGILTERDMPRLLRDHAAPDKVSLRAVMSSPVITVPVSMNVEEASARMALSHIKHLVVLDDRKQIIGVCSQHRMLERLGAVLIDEQRQKLSSRLDRVMTATGIGVWEYDCSSQYMVSSSTLNQILGLSDDAQTLVPLDEWLAVVHPEDRSRLEIAFLALHSSREDQLDIIEYRVRRHDGNWLWFSARAQVIERDIEGRALRVAGVFIDVTASKAALQHAWENEDRYLSLIDHLPLPLCQMNLDGRFQMVNPRFRTLFNCSGTDWPVLRRWAVLQDEENCGQDWLTLFQRCAASRSGSLECQVQTADGQNWRLMVSALWVRQTLLAVLIDHTDIWRHQTFLEYGNASLEQIVRADSDVSVLEQIALGLERLYPDMLVSILLLDEDGTHLQHGAAPSLPESYNKAVHGLAIGPDVGSCGRAAWINAPVYVSDIATDPLWRNYAVLALEHGLRACWSRPIPARDGRVQGTFAVYYKTIRQPGSAEVEAIEKACTLAALATERLRADTLLKSRLEELRRWHDATLGREVRVLELKREINDLLARLGEAPRYRSVAAGEPDRTGGL